MTAETVPQRALDRRFLMRGGAVLAGAAGLAAVGAVVAPTAQAADGGGVLLGKLNTAGTTTTISESGVAPTLSLVNSSGPTLKLSPTGFDLGETLAVGEIANSETGPSIGVDYGDGVETTYLATGRDLLSPVAFTPERLIDTRVSKDRDTIIGSSGSPFDSKGQLKAGAFIDIAVGELEDGPVSAVFLNLTAVQPATAGFLAVYPSGFDVPKTSNVNFQPKVTVCNSAFVAVGVLQGFYAIRVYAAKASHVIVDLTGMVYGGYPAEPDMAAKSGRRGEQARRITKMRNAVKKSAGR